MTNEAATTALLRYNADGSEQKRRDVQTALAELAEDPSQPINKSIVARRAGVSREFINSHPELGRPIEAAARQARYTPLPQHRDDTTISGLQAQNRTFAQQISQQKALIAELRSAIEELRRQRQLHLGAQLMASAVDPDNMPSCSLTMTAWPPRTPHSNAGSTTMIASSRFIRRTSPPPARPTPTTSLA